MPECDVAQEQGLAPVIPNGAFQELAAQGRHHRK